MYSIGLMSGTSMDGIDAALIETDGTSALLHEIAATTLDYDREFKLILKATEYAVRTCLGNVKEVELQFSNLFEFYLNQELGYTITQIREVLFQLSDYLDNQFQEKKITYQAVIKASTALHAAAVLQLLKESGYQKHQIAVIGYHGQTLFHQPASKLSITLGDGNYLSNKLGLIVIDNFRSQDVAAGGQGAPFAPLYHHALAVRDKKIPLGVVNCGGIANMTLINSVDEADLIAFDTGPGNGLIDRLIRKRTQGTEYMDMFGKYGLRGQVNNDILKDLYEKSVSLNKQHFFTMPPPKALDIGDLQLIPELDALSIYDACATLEAFTADSIVESLSLVKTSMPQCFITAGGGWKNPVIFAEFKNRLRQKFSSSIKILTADNIGWNSKSLEAQMCAYLAVRSLQAKYLSLPNTTGVSTPMCGGVMHVPNK